MTNPDSLYLNFGECPPKEALDVYANEWRQDLLIRQAAEKQRESARRRAQYWKSLALDRSRELRRLNRIVIEATRLYRSGLANPDAPLILAAFAAAIVEACSEETAEATQEEYDNALRKLAERVNGLVYAGDRLEAVIATVKALRDDRELAAALLREAADEAPAGTDTKETTDG